MEEKQETWARTGLGPGGPCLQLTRNKLPSVFESCSCLWHRGPRTRLTLLGGAGARPGLRAGTLQVTASRPAWWPHRPPRPHHQTLSLSSEAPGQQCMRCTSAEEPRGRGTRCSSQEAPQGPARLPWLSSHSGHLDWKLLAKRLSTSCAGSSSEQVSARAGAHLEPADTESARHPGWPRGQVCDLASDSAPRAPAPQPGPGPEDLAEGRNAIVDSVCLESVGFCRGSVLACGPQRWMLAMPGKGGDEVQILEMPSKTSVCSLKPEAEARPGMPMCLQLWQADSSPLPLLLAGYEDGSVALWDVSARKVCSRVACHEEPVMGLDFDSQKARGVSGSAEKALAVWSLDEQRALQVHGTHQLTNPGVADVRIRPDRRLLATAGWDHRIRVFHWRTMKPLAVLAFHSAAVHCLAFATDGLLAAGSGDQRISVWSLYPRM
uniref:Guanine nucleotide-binding protein subunit beta-like protein 1 isoform X1 n=1 Tax=Camelus bactrianus TaxID=9837 RepID=A0A9W3G7W8_CAMBA|nr:guanine nucleotide-binding protein subunit beta-like protein 1 isoform X1 [Camelus bactrianus]